MVQWNSVDAVRTALEDPSITPDGLLSALSVVDEAKAALVEAEAALILAARRNGVTWRGIADALDLVSPQAAAQRALRLQRRVPLDGRPTDDSSAARVSPERDR